MLNYIRKDFLRINFTLNLCLFMSADVVVYSRKSKMTNESKETRVPSSHDIIMQMGINSESFRFRTLTNLKKPSYVIFRRFSSFKMKT